VAIVLSLLLRFTDSDYPFGIVMTYWMVIACIRIDKRIKKNTTLSGQFQNPIEKS
jgi:hypothetical protein